MSIGKLNGQLRMLNTLFAATTENAKAFTETVAGAEQPKRETRESAERSQVDGEKEQESNANPTFGIGGLFGTVKTVATAQRQVIKETQEARQSLKETSDDLSKLFGDMSKHQRTILEEISQSSTGFYEGMTLLMRAMEVVENIKKSQKSGKGTFYLLEELDRVIFAINTFMGRSGRAIDKDTLFGLANRRDRNSGNDGRSTGGNP
jgi:hypothetical protein